MSCRFVMDGIITNFSINHEILDEMIVLKKCVYVWIKIIRVLRMWLHHYNDCCQFLFC